MNTKEAIQLLKTHGDPAERAILEFWPDISQVLSPYVGIWAHHVFPRRNSENPSFVTDAWMPFAGSHYTAIVRVANALEKSKRIKFICNEFEEGRQNGKLLLEAHDVFASFWEHVGSASENLWKCLQDAPCIGMDSPHKYVQNKFSVIDEAYDRRTQFIHSRLVPMGSDDGLLFFNVEHFKYKNTNWKEQLIRPVIASEYYEKIWTKILSDMEGLWSKLEQWLRDKDKGPFTFEPTPEQVTRKKTLKVFRPPSGFQPPSTITHHWEEVVVEELPPIQIPDIGPSGIQ